MPRMGRLEGEGMEELKKCPFCGHKNISIKSRQVRFIGQNAFGVKKIMISRYAACNKCHSRGKPIIFTVTYDGTINGKEDRNDSLVIKAWNRRCCE